MKRIITQEKLETFEAYLKDEERSGATVEKYMRDVRFFASFVGQSEIVKGTVPDYKSMLA